VKTEDLIVELLARSYAGAIGLYIPVNFPKRIPHDDDLQIRFTQKPGCPVRVEHITKAMQDSTRLESELIRKITKGAA
jgi:hypothetical protein